MFYRFDSPRRADPEKQQQKFVRTGGRNLPTRTATLNTWFERSTLYALGLFEQGSQIRYVIFMQLCLSH
jgi:hypothetical protein